MDAEQTPGTASEDKPVEATTPVQEQGSSRKGSWLDRILFRGSPQTSQPDLRASTTGPAPKADESTEEPKAGEARSSDQPKDKTPEPKAEDKPTVLTPAEFAQTEEGKRAIQAEVDRREAKRQADAGARQKIEERRRLRQEDPLAYADADERAEVEAERVRQTGEQIVGLWDAAVVTPIFSRLSDEEQAEVLKDSAAGLEGRRQIIERVIDREIARARKEAETRATERLRKNPAFRKELLLELRGEEQEPELLPAPSGASAIFDMNSLIRQKATRPRTEDVHIRN